MKYRLTEQYKHAIFFWFALNDNEYDFLGCNAKKIIDDDEWLTDEYQNQLDEGANDYDDFLCAMGFVNMDSCQLIESAEIDGADCWTVQQGFVELDTLAECEVCKKEAELHKVEYSDDVKMVCQECIDNYKDIDF